MREVDGGGVCGGMQGFSVAVEVGPGAVVVKAGVEELAAAQGGVAVLTEEMRKRNPVGVLVHEAGAVAEDVGVVWRATAEERGA